MSTMSRHMACKLCRDRKVRCDGEAECDNCKRSGEPCIYVPAQKPTKSDLIQTVNTLREKLANLEAVVANQNVAAAQPRTHKSQPGAAGELASLANHEFDFAAALFTDNINNLMSGQEDMIPMFRHPAPGSQNTENVDIDISGSPYGRASLSNGAHNNMSRYDTNGSPGTRNGSVGVHESAIDQGPNAVSKGSHMPALREIRARNLPGSPNIPQIQSPPANCEQLDVFFEALGEFLVAISRTQSEIGGISSVVAEYINWMRKEPLTIPAGASMTNFAMMLETLEARVKEVHDLAETRHLEAWQWLTTSISQYEGLVDKMSQIKEEMHKHGVERADLFKEEYNICVCLSEQKSGN